MPCKARSRAGIATCLIVGALALAGCGSGAAATTQPRAATASDSTLQTQLTSYLARVRPDMNTAGQLEHRVLAAVSQYASSPTRAALPGTLHVLHSSAGRIAAIVRHLAVTVPPLALAAAHGAFAGGLRAEAQVIDRIAHGIRTGARRRQPAELAALRDLISQRSRWRAAALAYAAHAHLRSPGWLAT